MNRKVTLLAALLVLSLPAAAQFHTVVDAIEVGLGDFRAPAASNGTVGIKQCEDCSTRLLRVSPATRYVINGNTVDLREFRRLILQVNDRDSRPVTVMHDLEADVVASIMINIPDED